MRHAVGARIALFSFAIVCAEANAGTAPSPRWPFGLQTSEQTAQFVCGSPPNDQKITVQGYIPIEFAQDCPLESTRDGVNHTFVTDLEIPTRGQTHSNANASYARNGNLIDLANASHYEQTPLDNNIFNASSNWFPFYYTDSTLFSSEGNPCAGHDMDTFRYLPFWASEKLTVKFCVYRYDPDTTPGTKQLYTQSLKQMPGGILDRGYYDNVSIAQRTFSSDMNMEPPMSCSSSDTMCMPGRCGMLDTNYLFRLSDRTDTIFKFAYTFDSTNGISDAYIAVYGKAQCDPMYGGGLVDAQKDPFTIKYPRNGEFDSQVWHRYADGYDAYSSDALDDYITETGSLLALPTYSFVSWKTLGKLNPNPMWWYRTKDQWLDGDPVGIRRFDRLGSFESEMPNCSSFGAFAPLSKAGYNPNPADGESKGAFDDYQAQLYDTENQNPSDGSWIEAVKAKFSTDNTFPTVPSQFFVLPLKVYATISSELRTGNAIFDKISANQGARYTTADLLAGADVVVMPWLTQAAVNTYATSAQGVKDTDTCAEKQPADFENCKIYGPQDFGGNKLILPAECGGKAASNPPLAKHLLLNVSQHFHGPSSADFFYRSSNSLESFQILSKGVPNRQPVDCTSLPKLIADDTRRHVNVFATVVLEIRGGAIGGFPGKTGPMSPFGLYAFKDHQAVQYTADQCFYVYGQTAGTIQHGELYEYDDKKSVLNKVTRIEQNSWNVHIGADPSEEYGLCFPPKPKEVPFFYKQVDDPFSGEKVTFFYTYPKHASYDDSDVYAQLRVLRKKYLTEWNPAKKQLTYPGIDDDSSARPVFFNFATWVNGDAAGNSKYIPFWESLKNEGYEISSNASISSDWVKDWNLFKHDETINYGTTDVFDPAKHDNWKPRIVKGAVLSPYIQNQTFPGQLGSFTCDDLVFEGNDTVKQHPKLKNTDMYKACVLHGYTYAGLWSDDIPNLIGPNSQSELRKFACPVSTGCMLRPVGETKASQYGTAADGVSAQAALMFAQAAPKLQCLPMWKMFKWDEWPGPKPPEKDFAYYAADPGTYLTKIKLADSLFRLSTIYFKVSPNAVPQDFFKVVFFKGQIYEQTRKILFSSSQGVLIGTLYSNNPSLAAEKEPILLNQSGVNCTTKIWLSMQWDYPLDPQAAPPLTILNKEGKSDIMLNQPGCESIDFFKSQLQYGNRERYIDDSESPEQWMYYERMQLEPFTILPPTTSAIKTVPVEISHFSTQLTQNFADPKSVACDCGGAGGIKFYFESSFLGSPQEQEATSNFQDAVNFLFSNEEPELKHIKPLLGYRKSGYSWNTLLSPSTPLIGIPITSRKSFTLVERDIFRDPTLSAKDISELFGTESGQPDWTLPALRSRYWFDDDVQSLRNTDLTQLWLQDYSQRTINPNSPKAGADPVTDTNFADTDIILVQLSGNDWVCPVGTIDAFLMGRCYCTSADCELRYKCPMLNTEDLYANYSTISKTWGDQIDASLSNQDTRVTYIYSKLPTTKSTFSTRIECYRTFEHAYEFETSCLRYPYGMVQSWELDETARDKLFPPPASIMTYTYNYCEDLNANPDAAAPRFMDCANDHLSYEQRISFCDLGRNPLVMQVMEALVILERPLSSVCSATLKACLLVPGTASFGSLKTLMNNGAIDLAGYTILVAPVTNAFLGRAQALTYVTAPKNQLQQTKQLDAADEAQALGFSLDVHTFAILATIESAHSIDDIKRAMTQLASDLRTVPPNTYCGPNQLRRLAESGSNLWYECADKNWWGYPFLNASDVLVKYPDLAIESADTNSELVFQRSCSRCTVFHVGSPGFALPNAVFEDSDECCTKAEPAVVFSGASAANSKLSIRISNVKNGGAPVQYLGYESDYFGSHPIINVDNASLDLVVDPSSSTQFAAGFARASGSVTVRSRSTPDLKVLVQSAHPAGTAGLKSKPLVVIGSPIYNITLFVELFGDAVERRLFPRPADHTATLIVSLAIALFTVTITASKGVLTGPCRRHSQRFRLKQALQDARLQHPHHVNFKKNFVRFAKGSGEVIVEPPTHDWFGAHSGTILFKTRGPGKQGPTKYYDAAQLLHTALKEGHYDSGINTYLSTRLDDDLYGVAETALKQAKSLKARE